MPDNLDSRLLVVVPARGGSKRVPGKNVRLLGGQPLLGHTAAALRASGLTAPVLVTTDDSEIAACGRRFGWTVVDRPDALAGDATRSEPTVLHALDSWIAAGGQSPDLIMMLQPTSPFRGGPVLTRAVATLDARPDANAVVGVCPLHVGLRHVLTVDREGFAEPVSGAAGRAFVPNGAVYLIRTSALRRYDSFFPPKTLPLEMDPIASLDIDTEDDWRLAEAIVAAGLCPVEPAP